MRRERQEWGSPFKLCAVAAAVVGAGLAGSVISAGAQSDAADSANAATTAGNQAAIAEQQRQFDAVRQLLSPYASAGTGALTGQQNLIGLNGNAAQQTAINGIQSSPGFTSLVKQGENSILQNASATGGLRGGNTQAALAQFSPQLLNQLIQQQYSNLGGITSLGQNAAAGVGNAGMATGNNISSLLAGIGSSNAANSLAQGSAIAGLGNGLGSAAGAYAGLGGFGNSSNLQSQFSQTPLGSSGFGTGLAYGNQDYGAFF